MAWRIRATVWLGAFYDRMIVSLLLQAPGLADENGNNGELPKIVVGVCAMDRKVNAIAKLLGSLLSAAARARID